MHRVTNLSTSTNLQSTEFPARDHWSAYVSRPSPAPRATHAPQNPYYNPLAPLRKRFARAISAGRQVSVELQLVVELVDALEHCIVAFSGQGDDPLGVGRNRSSTPSQSNGRPGSAASTASMSYVVGLSASTAVARAADLELMNEVRSLVKELVEICPDAQTCLTDGGYGPLAHCPSSSAAASTTKPPSIGGGRRPKASTSANASPARAASSNTASHSTKLDMKDPGTADWWPRRLARDCRALLDEVGVTLGGGTAPTLLLGSQAGVPAPPLPLDPSLLDEGKRRWEAYRKREAVNDQ